MAKSRKIIFCVQWENNHNNEKIKQKHNKKIIIIFQQQKAIKNKCGE